MNYVASDYLLEFWKENRLKPGQTYAFSNGHLSFKEKYNTYSYIEYVSNETFDKPIILATNVIGCMIWNKKILYYTHGESLYKTIRILECVNGVFSEFTGFIQTAKIGCKDLKYMLIFLNSREEICFEWYDSFEEDRNVLISKEDLAKVGFKEGCSKLFLNREYFYVVEPLSFDLVPYRCINWDLSYNKNNEIERGRLLLFAMNNYIQKCGVYFSEEYSRQLTQISHEGELSYQVLERLLELHRDNNMDIRIIEEMQKTADLFKNYGTEKQFFLFLERMIIYDVDKTRLELAVVMAMSGNLSTYDFEIRWALDQPDRDKTLFYKMSSLVNGIIAKNISMEMWLESYDSFSSEVDKILFGNASMIG